jgi:hypothetical protein
MMVEPQFEHKNPGFCQELPGLEALCAEAPQDSYNAAVVASTCGARGNDVLSFGLTALLDCGAAGTAVRAYRIGRWEFRNETAAALLRLSVRGRDHVFLVAVGAGAGLLWHFSKDLPDYSQLQDYEPPVMTRVHAGDGSLVAEYATQRRLYIPIQAVPKMVINAFLAAEDKNFYEHNGLDFGGIARAGILYVQTYGSGRRPQGASPSPSRSPRTSF